MISCVLNILMISSCFLSIYMSLTTMCHFNKKTWAYILYSSTYMHMYAQYMKQLWNYVRNYGWNYPSYKQKIHDYPNWKLLIFTDAKQNCFVPSIEKNTWEKNDFENLENNKDLKSIIREDNLRTIRISMKTTLEQPVSGT